ncbi:MAG: Crp/Fnr family transcriptional regulator [Gammaproteobacteria bacterium]|nr:Crp/Fnr family transcriptional regulator [Gammaproteobacteria bacterium]
MTSKNLTTQCFGCKLKSKSIFTAVEHQALEKARFVPEVVSYPPNSSILSASANDAIFTVRKGTVKMQRAMPDGNKRITSLLKSGDTLGLRAWQTGEYDFDAIALGDVELCRIPHRELNRIRKYTTALEKTVISRLCKEGELAEIWITHFSSGSVNQRLANLLLFLATHQDETNSKTVKLLSRDDMASILGVRQESVSRAVTQFKAEGLIVVKSRGEHTLNLPALRKQSKQK